MQIAAVSCTHVFNTSVFLVGFTHQCVYINSFILICSRLFIGKDEEIECNPELQGAYRSVFGAVVCTVLTRAGLAVCVQAFQRRAHAPMITDCKRLDIVFGYMKRHKCGSTLIRIQHPFKLVGRIGAAFKAQIEEPIGFAFRGLAAVLRDDEECGAMPNGPNREANSVDSQ